MVVILDKDSLSLHRMGAEGLLHGAETDYDSDDFICCGSISAAPTSQELLLWINAPDLGRCLCPLG